MASHFDPQPPDRSTEGTGGKGTGGTNALEAGAPTETDLLQIVARAQQIAKDYQQRTIERPLQRSYRAWRNEHAEESKYLGPAWRGRSRLFVPKTRSAIRKNLATTAASLFSTEDVVNITASYEDDPFQKATAATLKGVLDQRLTQASATHGIPWFIICMGGCLDGQLTGVTISKQYWEYREVPSTEFETVLVPEVDEDGNAIVDEMGEPLMVEGLRPVMKVVRDRPNVELFPIENAGIDPAAPWYNPAQLGRWFFMRYPMGLADAKAMMASGEKDGWLEVDDETLLKGRAEEERAGVRRVREGGPDRYEEGKAPGDELDIVWLQENFVRIAGIDYHFWSVDRHAFISKVRRTEEVYPALGGERPYVMGVAQIDTHRVFPMSPVESWQPLQLELNDITNLRLDTLKRSIAPLAKVRKGKGVDLTAVQRRGQPDSILLLDNPDDVTLEPTPGPSGQAYTETSITNANFDELAGVFSTSSVQQSRQLNETVGGMRLMSGSANSVSEFDLRIWVETWVEPVLRQLLHLVKNHESDERMVLVAGQKARVMQQFGYQPTLADFDYCDVTLRVNVGVGAADPMQRIAKLRMAMEMLAPMVPIMEKQGITPKMEEFIDEVMGSAGFKDGRRFFEFGERPEQQQNPELQKVMLEMQLEREKMQNDFRAMLIELMSEEKRNTENNETKLQIANVQGRNQIAGKVVDIAADREARQHGDMVRREDGQNQRRQEAIRLFADRLGGSRAQPQPSQEQATPLQPQAPAMPDPGMMMMSRMIDQLNQMQMGQASLMQAFNALQARMSAPAEIVRDAMGRPVGVRKAGQFQEIVRDGTGMIAGTAPAQQPAMPATQ